MKDEFLHDFAAKIFRIDKSIRLICIADQNGRVLGSDYRNDILQKMSEAQLEEYIKPWVIQLLMTDRFRVTAGDLRYILAIYEKMLSSAIQVNFNPKQKIFVILSFDLAGPTIDSIKLIEDKILPLIGENKDFFL